MAWVRFMRDYEWSPPELRKKVILVYRSGKSYMVTSRCALASIVSGAAVKCEPPPNRRKSSHGSG